MNFKKIKERERKKQRLIMTNQTLYNCKPNKQLSWLKTLRCRGTKYVLYSFKRAPCTIRHMIKKKQK